MLRNVLIICLLYLPLVSMARDYLDLTKALSLSLTDKLWERKEHAMAAACTYRSVDQFGDSITLSGKIFMPKEGRA